MHFKGIGSASLGIQNLEEGEEEFGSVLQSQMLNSLIDVFRRVFRSTGLWDYDQKSKEK